MPALKIAENHSQGFSVLCYAMLENCTSLFLFSGLSQEEMVVVEEEKNIAETGGEIQERLL